ncbi:MAG: EamA family transporter [Chloroflexi bacterium HGW-Chloroflexi-3]|nr:MAG: EamA family transporter [Chloroflexi bacterium HGW-Chloroflexi-3]
MGEIAAISAAFLWALSSILFSFSGKQIGSTSLNRIRLSFAFLFLIITHTLVYGTPIPLNATNEQWIWLGLSSIIGLVVGDLFLFQSFIMVGPRLAMLVMAISPVISALFAWIFLGETLSLLQISGIILTIGGISLVILDRNNSHNPIYGERRKWVGILFGVGAAIGQAVGLIFAKKGLPPEFPALSGVVIRVLVAVITVWFFAILTKQFKKSFQQFRQFPKAFRFAFAGAMVGPFLGVWLSLIAVQFAKVGIASTLMALTPIFHLPIGTILKEKITKQAIAGTFIAMVGVAIIFL